MIKWMLHRGLTSFERKQSYDATFMHEVLDADVGAFFRFNLATLMGNFRKDLPLEAHFAAGLTSSMLADCGPCTQLGVNFGLEAGLSAATLTSIIAADEATMSPDVLLGSRFARAVLARSSELDTLREEIVRRFGNRALIALAFAIMAGQLYPTLKYALGHGKSCTRVVVAGAPVAARRDLRSAA